MKEKNNLRRWLICVLLLLLSAPLAAQNVTLPALTVRDIMAEPSLAGMRPEGERLSPDGKYIVFLWNAEGREPRNLYIVNSNGSDSRILVNAEANFEPRTLPPESKLDYGLSVRDDFVKAREKNLFGAEFSPDSRRILFLQNSDIYVLDLEEKFVANESKKDLLKTRWQMLEANFIRRANLMPSIINAVKAAGIQENEIFARIENVRTKILNDVNEKPAESNGDKSAVQKQRILEENKNFDTEINRLLRLPVNYPALQANENFLKIQDELEGTENRIAVAKRDYDFAVRNSSQLAKPRRITRTQGTETSARWLTNEAILYSSNGNYFVLNLRETSLIQVTKEANPAAFISIQNIASSKDGGLIAYVVSDGAKQRALFVPNYLDEFTQAPTTRRGWTEQKILVTATDGSNEKPIEIKLPKPEGVSYLRAVKFAADNRSLLIDRVDKDTKRRQLFLAQNPESPILLTEETDNKWIAPLSRLVEPHPKDPTRILFASEKDGFNHLYLATLDAAKSVKIEQLTKGNFEVDWAKWTADGNQIIFSSTEANTAEREFYAFDFAVNNKIKVSSGEPGMKLNPQIDEANSQPTLLYEFSQWNQPTELFAVKVCPRCRGLNFPAQITKTIPEKFKQVAWLAPQFINVPTTDAKTLKAKVYLPPQFDKTKKYPLVFFTHGAGYLQNVINGWNNYYREFMFNQILAQRGFVVLDIDYRGSAGYGQAWRTDVAGFLGELDLKDHLDAIDFAVKNYAVDAKKVGIYGGSYGGFMAEMAILRAPELFACAAALRPVSDWKNYYASSPVYTAERLGFPDKNAEAYKRSSPISYAAKLSKPLLILHGIMDDNVHVQDSMQFVEKLIRNGKTDYFETMFYPAENHGFGRAESWADEYERILKFFEKNLKH